MLLVGYIIALIISFYLLAEVSDKYFVISLDKLSHRLKMSHDMAGATFMAIGSSAPELFVSLIAIFRPGDHSDIGVGTIVGSALFNLLVIVGAAAMVKNTVLAWQPVIRDLLFYAIAIAGLYIVLNNGRITMLETSIFIGVYVVYVYAVVNWRKWFKYKIYDEDPVGNHVEEDPKTGWQVIFKPFDWLLARAFPAPEHYLIVFFISVMFIGVLCWVLVESAIGISNILHIPEVVIALTVLAVGTSVPDMISSVIVAKQGRAGMAVSNAIGSNIFDIFIGLGVPWLLKIILIDKVLLIDIHGLGLSVGLLFGSSLFILFVLMFKKWQLSHGLGFFLIMLYILYVIWEILKLYVI
jgi:K+-dependent Na+/Ca+ exchanger-like protein